MANIGCLGEIPFMVSSRTIQTIQNATWSGSARYGIHDRHLGDALTEYTGRDPDGFTFDMQLSAYLGVDPMDAIVKLWGYLRNGTAVPLTIGDKAYGKYRWNVTKIKIKMENHDRRGNLTSADVSVELQEYVKG